jgi:hypothetical protein
MAETRTLTDHDAIRSWAAARIGAPAIIDVSPESGVQPHLAIVFDQAAYQDQDRPERPPNAGGYELVEWDEWFRIFDDAGLALTVSEERPGSLDSWHRIVQAEEHHDEGDEATAWDDDDEDIRFLAENTDLSPRQAGKLVAEHGRDRDRLLELARTMKAEG